MTNPLLNLIIAGLAALVGLWLFWPDRGFFWRWQRTRHLTRRVLIEPVRDGVGGDFYGGSGLVSSQRITMGA